MISQRSEWPSEGQFLDFRDKDNGPWQVGLVVSRIKNMLKVRSQGWASKYDEFLPTTSSKIRPFRSQVRGYTGQQKNPSIRDHWKYSPEKHEERLQNFRTFCNSYSEKSEEQITQFLRGNHYFYLDFLMTLAYTRKEDLQFAYIYFREHLLFTKRYLLEISVTGVSEWCNEATQISESARAYRDSYYELLDGIYIIMGLYARQLTFQKNSDKVIKEVTNDNTHEKHIAKIMQEIGLDDAYLAVLEKLYEETVEQGKSIPISFLYAFFHTFLPVEKSILQKSTPPYNIPASNKDERKKIVGKFYEIIKKQLFKITSAHLKNQQSEKEIQNLLIDMKTCYFKYGLEQMAFEYIEKTKLKIAALLIDCDTLQRKLKGIAKMKEIYETIIVNNEYSVFKLSKETLAGFISEQSVISSLYLENQHPEILKKGSELCQMFFRQGLIGLSDMIFIWEQCRQKHEAVRKIILQMWIDIIPFVSGRDLDTFVNPICTGCIDQGYKLFVQEWQIELLFTFIYQFVKSYADEQNTKVMMSQITPILFRLGYMKLVSLSGSNNFNHLLSEYSKLINVSVETCNEIIRECFVQVAKSQNMQVNIPLLIQFYVESTRKNTLVPSNAVEIILQALENPINQPLSSSIFQLLDETINFSNLMLEQSILTKQTFALLWANGQKSVESKQQFYNWLLKKNNEGLFGVPLFEINLNIPSELKTSIFTDFLCNHNQIDYFNFTIQELSIFKEFLLFQNEAEHKIQIRKLMNLIKVVRVRPGDITGMKQVWDIFLNCKNEEVIKKLSKIILCLHFHFYESVDFATKKAKAVVLMNRLDKYIKDGFKKGNLKLMKHSLILLKDIIDYVKQKPIAESILQNYQQYFKTTIKILFESQKHEIQIFFGVTYYEIKSRIADIIKLDRTEFQLINSKNEQIGIEFSEVPFCFMQQKTIKVKRLTDNDQTIPNIVLNFIKDKIENTLIDMLEDESICENVYNVLEDIEIKIEQGEALFEKLVNAIERHEKDKVKHQFNSYQIYFHLFYLRILQFLIDKPKFLRKFINSGEFSKLISKLNVQINHHLVVAYMAHATQSIAKIIKKFKHSEDFKESESTLQILNNSISTLKQSCMGVLSEICNYINNNFEQKQASNAKKIRILFNCLNIIEAIEEPANLINYLLSHPKFEETLQKVYLRENYNQVRFIFAEKLKKFIKNNKGVSHEIEVKFSEIFIRSLYYKARAVEGKYSSNKRVTHLYHFIAFLIKFFQPHNFDVEILQSSFYNDLFSNLQAMEDPIQAIESVNYLLSAHLHILAAIFEKRPSLLQDENKSDFLLYDCLFYREGKSTRLDVKCKRPESIKQALNALQALSLDHQHPGKLIIILNQIEHFHRISYWRTSEYWSTTIENEVKAKYVGLQNPGCICYHNSLMQQLFMIEDFRKTVYALKLQSESEIEEQKEEVKFQLLKALKELFFSLEYSEQIALSPVFFTKTIKGYDNKPVVKLLYQMDIDQFCSILFDKIEQQLTALPNQPNIIKDYFGGTFAHQIISKECTHSSEREEQFLSIGLEVKKSILQSFNALVKGQMLDGQNKYHCEKCDKKVKAEKMLTLKVLPKNLILSLKRFEFNYEIDAKIKINDFCEFPTQLNLKKYSQQQINKLNAPVKLIEQQLEEPIEQELSDEYFTYKLKGVVVHTGSTDSGHYYSFVQDKEKKWFQFNDSHVSPFDFKNLPEETFGCKDTFDQKTKNAYLIFYEKVEQKAKEDKVQSMQQVEESEQNHEIIDTILHKNKIINKFRLLFSSNYSEFVSKIVEHSQRFVMNDFERKLWHQFLLSYYLLIKIREGSLEEVIKFSKIIQKLILTNLEFRDLFIDTVSSFSYLEEVFVYSSAREKCKIMASLMADAYISYLVEMDVGVQFEGDQKLAELFSNLRPIFTIHGNIYELEMFLRLLLQIFQKRQDKRLIIFLSFSVSFSKILLTNLFSFSFIKEEKDAANQAKELKILEHNRITGLNKSDGKKYLPIERKQSWHILSYLLNYIIENDNPDDLTVSEIIKEIGKLFGKVIETLALTRVIYECATKRCIYYFFKACQPLSISAKIIDAIEKGLKDYESTKYRPFMNLLYYIIFDHDANEAKIDNVIEMLVAVHEVNEKYFLEVNFLHQWILKFASVNALFLKKLSDNTEFLDNMDQWMITKPMPSADLVKKHKNPTNERLLNRLHGILVSADPRQYEKKTKMLRYKFKCILHRKFELINNTINFELENSEDFADESIVQYFDVVNNKWTRGKIVDRNFTLLKVLVQGEEKKELHFWEDCERLELYHEETITEMVPQLPQLPQLPQEMSVEASRNEEEEFDDNYPTL